MDELLDVAIVGAGVSGLYTAFRLTDDPEHERSVAVFESSKRIGGRLLSPHPPGAPTLAAELGGMRFMDTQPLVSGLVRELGLDTEPLDADRPENLVHLRNTLLRRSQLTSDPDAVPYELGPLERGLDPGALVGQALGQALPRLAATPADLRTDLETRTVRGMALHDWGFWNLLSMSMSHEAFRLAQKGMGYDTALHNWNAADTVLMNADFGPDATYSRLVEGYEALPLELASRLAEREVEVHRHHRLESFDTVTLDDGTTGVEAHFQVTTDDGSSEGRTVRARHLVLAMPRRSIELLKQTGAVLGDAAPGVRDLIESVTPNPLFKAALVYEEPWWEALGVTVGRSVTDLPVRQIYYWGAQRAAVEKSADDRAMLLVYDDGQNVDFWAGFRDPTDTPAVDRGNADGSAAWEDYRAPAAMVAELHRQVLLAHGVRDAPAPIDAVCFFWGDDPYGGGVNFWKVGVRSWEAIPQLAQPVVGVPVHICGEAYSAAQGWVEGALQTAELVLTEHLDSPAPRWVRSGAPS